MVKRIVGFIVVVIVCVTGTVVKNVNSGENISEKTNQIDTEKVNTIIEVAKDTNEIQEESNIVNGDNKIEKIEDNKIVNENKNDSSVSNSNKKDNTINSNNIPKTTNTQKQNNNKQTETQVEQKEEGTQATATKEEKPVEIAKEEYIYNDTETKRLISDIDEIAKRNSSLWNKDGSKKYQIEKSSSLLGKNYMSPYSKPQLEGIVLNVFSVKFLVYAVDYHKTGFATETRYYIDIAEYSKK